MVIEHADADDIAQIVWMKVWEKLDGFKMESKLVEEEDESLELDAIELEDSDLPFEDEVNEFIDDGPILHQKKFYNDQISSATYYMEIMNFYIFQIY